MIRSTSHEATPSTDTSRLSRSRQATKLLLKKAVHQHAATKGKGMLERLFTLWFDGMVYNQIWEDPRVDAQALELKEGSRILAISSGGCNLLNYLLYRPAEVHAVDLNMHHMHLTRLKLSALKHLPSYEDFFQFFAVAQGKENLKRYKQYLRETLDSDTRKYWEKLSPLRALGARRRIHYFSRNLYNYSRSGYFIRFLHIICRFAKCDTKKLLSAKSLEEQEALFRKHLDPSFDHWIVKTLGKLPVMVYSLGIPPQQFRVMSEEGDNQIVELFRDRVRRLACNFPIQENYFAWQAFGRRYNIADQDALPDYLKRENYETIRELSSRIRTEVISLTDYLKERPDNSLDSFVFLDSQDWMTPSQIAELWGEVARVGEPGARIIFRTAGYSSPVEKALPADLKSRFQYDQETSQKFYEQDRSAIYGGFHVYTLSE